METHSETFTIKDKDRTYTLKLGTLINLGNSAEYLFEKNRGVKIAEANLNLRQEEIVRLREELREAI
jgi:hypothetical protein